MATKEQERIMGNYHCRYFLGNRSKTDVRYDWIVLQGRLDGVGFCVMVTVCLLLFPDGTFFFLT